MSREEGLEMKSSPLLSMLLANKYGVCLVIYGEFLNYLLSKVEVYYEVHTKVCREMICLEVQKKLSLMYRRNLACIILIKGL